MMPVLIALLAALVFASPVWAACGGSSPNLTTADASIAEINLCMTAAVAGDTITVSDSSETWTGSTPVLFPTTKHVTLIASGTVTITDNTTSAFSPIRLREATTGNNRLEGFTIVKGTATHVDDNAMLKVEFTSSGLPVLVTGNTFTLGTVQSNAMYVQTNRGVVWNNTFQATLVDAPSTCANASAAIRHKPSGLVTTSWSSVLTRGNEDTNGNTMLYFEKNTIINVNEGLDIDDGARMVVRYNTFRNSAITFHGDSSYPGGRYGEIYKNWFDNSTAYTCDPGGLFPNLNGWITFRAGTAIIMQNLLENQDNNGWGSKTEIAFNVDALRRNVGSYACYTGGYPAYPGQPGWGWLNQAHDFTLPSGGHAGDDFDLEPIIVTGNTGTFDTGPKQWNCNDPDSCDHPDVATCEARASVSTFVVANREYYAQNASFTGAGGTGSGLRSARPATCTTGVAYYSTDIGSWNTTGELSPSGNSIVQGVIDKCTDGTNPDANLRWTNGWFTPCAYPHNLTLDRASSCSPAVDGSEGASRRPSSISGASWR
jgi:hypothetical protein